jgi:parallel beta-helix repeat protein
VEVGGPTRPFTLGTGAERQLGITLTEPLRVDSHEVTVRRFRRFWQQLGHPRPADGAVLRYPDGRELRWEAGWEVTEPRFAAEHPSCTWTSTPGEEAAELRPINCVDWFTAQAFCVWDGGRLPTEVEREWLSGHRAGQQPPSPRSFPWGNDLGRACDYSQWTSCLEPVPFTGPRPVGGKEPVGGLFDLSGNVAEWVADVHRDYSDVGCWGNALQEGPLCDNGPDVLAGTAWRGVRGGSLNATSTEEFRNDVRKRAPPETRSEDIGFRCVRSTPLPDAPASVKGLQGEYFSGLDLADRRMVRIDEQVSFNWREGGPEQGFPVDQFSVRWTGRVRPRYSEVYTFITASDDGVRLWVDGQLLIDNWRHQPTESWSGTTRLPLQAGRPYDLRLEYFEGGLTARAGLSWKSPRQVQEVLPGERLSPHAPRYPGEDSVGGVVLPGAAWPVPPDAVFVSTDGDDSAPGSLTRPVRTLSRGIEVAADAGTVVLRGGTYRLPPGNGVALANLPRKLTLQPYPHERVWFKGSQVVPDTAWSRSGNLWAAPLAARTLPLATQVAALFCSPATCIDPAHPEANHREQVFVRNVALRQVLKLADVAPGTDTFYVDRDASPPRLYLGVDPAGALVEVTVAERGLEMVDNKEAGTDSAGATVRGLGFAHFAEVALRVNRPGVTLQGNAFAWNAMQGLSVNGNAGATDVHVLGNVFGHNGRLGLSAFAAHGLRVEDNLFAGNNAERFLEAVAGGLRLAQLHGGVVQGNRVRGNQAPGIRVDESARGALVLRNRVQDNLGTGILIRRSHQTGVASNLVLDNAGTGVLVDESSQTRLFNNTVVDNEGGIWLRDDSSRNPEPSSLDAGVTWDVTATVIRNNHLSGGTGPLLSLSDCAGATSGQMVSELDSNAYARPRASTPAMLIRWVDGGCAPAGFSSLSGFKQAYPGRETAGIARDGTGEHPLLNAPNGGDYRTRSTALPPDAGSPLPADLAEQLGVPGGVPAGIGVLEP